MKQTKSEQIKVRITPKEKEELQQYCEAYNVSISECLRAAIQEYLGGKTK